MQYRKAGSSVVALAVAAAVAVEADAQRRHSIPAKPDDKTIVHVLNRLGYGPAPGDIDRVRALGLSAYIEQQLHPERIADQGMAAHLDGLSTLTMSSRDMAQDIFLPAEMARREAQRTGTPVRPPQQPGPMQGERRVIAELNQQKLLRAAYSEKQLNEVMVDFWFNHFNVFAGKGQTRTYITEYERDVIRPHAFGKFRDLLGAVAESPAMLFYLDNWQSAAPADAETMMAERGRPGMRGRPGLGRRGRAGMEMMPEPPPQRRRGLNENYARELLELHTLGVDGGYTQKDVQEVARAFTGWTIQQPRQGGAFRFEPRLHDNGEKVVLGMRIAPGGGKKDGEQVLDLLATHPSTARFIATKLARRFVADDPPKALVDRAAQTFRSTGGDIREVVRTIVTSAEFFASAAQRAKVKTPFEFVASALRATGANTSNALPLINTLREQGMPLYMCQPPTGYADRADAWVNTGALLGRMNFSVALASGRMRGVTPASAVTADTIAAAALAGEVSASTRETVAKATAKPQALALILGSPEFQRK
jgi:uncharacterized protein (DUF1800 family)